MEKGKIEQIVNDILVTKIELKEEMIERDASLKDDLGIDSLSLLDLLTFLEKAFTIKIKLYELDGVETLEHLYDFLENKIRVKEQDKTTT